MKYRFFLLSVFYIASTFFLNSVAAQLEIREHTLSQSLTVNTLENLFENSSHRSDSVYILELNDDFHLHLQIRRTDQYKNGGAVKVYNVLNHAAAEFLLSRHREHFFASFSSELSQYRLVVDGSGNLLWMEDLWDLMGCGTDDLGFSRENFKATHNRSASGDSLNLLMAFSPSGVNRVMETVNVFDSTALYLWSNTAVSYLNLALENSGFEPIFKLALIESVNYQPLDAYDALGAIQDFKYDLGYLEDKVEEHCIHIRSFLMDYTDDGLGGVAYLFTKNTTSLSNSSIINFTTFCHEVGHNLGFGHGPKGRDDEGFFPFSRGFNTENAGIDGPYLATLMDYGSRVFWYSNQERPYDGEYEEQHGIFLGADDRDHIRTFRTILPLIISNTTSSWDFIDTTICEGSSLFGYSVEGVYRDTFPDAQSCNGLRIRDLTLSLRPPIESNFDSAHSLITFFPKDTVVSPIIKYFLFSDSLWVMSSNHIYVYEEEASNFRKVTSFPDTEKGPSEHGEMFPDFLGGMKVLEGEILVETLQGETYRYNSEENDWEEMDWPTLPVRNPETGTLSYAYEGKVYLSSDGGENWERADIPFEGAPSGIHLQAPRFLGGQWFISQIQPKEVLWVSMDDGFSWTSVESGFRANLHYLIFANDTYYLPANGLYHFSSDGGISWEVDSFLSEYIQVLYSEGLESFVLLSPEGNTYFLSNGDSIPLYITDKFLNGLIFIMDKTFVAHAFNFSDEGNYLGVSLYNLSEIEVFKKEVVICRGDDYYGYDEPGRYSIEETDGPCHSIFSVDLKVVDTIQMSIDTTLCHGQSFDGYSESGNYTEIFQNPGGCDTMRNIELTVLESLEIEFEKSHDSGKGDGFIAIEGIDGGLPPYELSWSNGQTTGEIADLTHGEYILTITDANQCKYEFIFQIEFSSVVVGDTEEEFKIRLYPNPVKTGMPLELKVEPEGPVYLKLLTVDGQLYSNWSRLTTQITAPSIPGVYIVQIKNQHSSYALRLLVIE